MLDKQNNLVCGRYTLSLDKPLLMGILNVTPDSFSDGGRFANVESALQQARRMIQEGADIIDIGGESTRPGADRVSDDEELQRVIPVIEKLSAEIDVPISIDTGKAVVMYEAIQAGASMINDVYALQQADALETAARLNVPVCLMHMQGVPESMQNDVHYSDAVKEVLTFLTQRIDACTHAGIDRSQLIIDPGFGFGKRLEHNLSLLNALPLFMSTGCPVLVGLSRKSMLAQITGKPANERLAGSLALATIAANLGAQIIRVHDVAETRDVLDVVSAVKQVQHN